MAADRPWWPAPTADGPVSATVTVPGSKSMTNRALLLAALADGPCAVRGALWARDTVLMRQALSALGVQLRDVGDDIQITPQVFRGGGQVDCGLAGNVMRFVPGVAALADGDVRFDGDERARVRPMAALVTGLTRLGARVLDDGRGTLPFTVAGTGSVAGGEVELDASSSSQFVSGLLLVGARYDRGVVVRHRGERLPSLPHVAMTVEMLERHGVQVSADTADPRSATWTVAPGRLRAVDTDIEPDLSNAAPFLAAAVVTGGSVVVPGWPSRTTQAGDALRGLFDAMGAGVELTEAGLRVVGTDRPRGIDVDLADVGELAPVLAAVCALATSPSRLRGIAHLRGHETDRLAALVTELTAMGARVSELPDGLTITPRPLRATRFATYDDHRMATAAAVLGLVVPGVEVQDVATTGKTLPDFPAMWERMLGRRDAAA